MNTNLLYLNDTYLWQGQSRILSVDNDDTGLFIELDSTLFYPRGGGQDADSGQIISDAGGVAQVKDVRFIEGQVRHYVDFHPNFLPNETVRMQVDGIRRLTNSAIHTAGHLICGLLTQRFKSLNPSKGYHFANGPYVEFDGETGIDNQSLAQWLQPAVQSAVQSGWRVETRSVNYETLVGLCSFIPTGLPTDKPLRVVTIGDLEPLPCGGTHLSSLSGFENVRIRKVKNNRGILRVSYETQLP